MSNFQKLSSGIGRGAAVQGTDIGSGAATSSQFLAASGGGASAFRSILSTDIPTLNQNTTGTASNITASSNATLTSLSALTSASSLATVGTITSGTWQGSAIVVTYGGTGATSFTTYMPICGGTTTTSALQSVSISGASAGYVLTYVSSSALPTWQAAATGNGFNYLSSNLSVYGGTNSTLSFSGTGNAVVGIGAAAALNSGTNNTIFGNNAGAAISGGTNNTFIGFDAGQNTTSGSNTFVGYQAGKGSTTNGTNTALGANAFSAGSNTSSGIVAIGNNAGDAITSGSKNTLVGSGVGTGLVSGTDNTLIGYQAGVLTTGSFNTILGSASGVSLTSGAENIIIGAGAQAATLQTGSHNQLIGSGSDTSASGTTGATIIGDGVIGASDSVTIGHALTNSFASIALGSIGSTTQTAVTNANGQFSIGSVGIPITSMFLGNGAVGVASPSAIIISPTPAAGSNVVGSNFTIKAGNGTGTGGSGNIIFQTAAVGTTGSAVNTYATQLSITKTGIQIPTGATNNYVLTSDASGNATWQPASGGSATSSPTASTTMARDSNANTQINNIVQNFSTTATAAGTTTLTVASSPLQQFTGTTTQTVQLPNATTLFNGTQYTIFNASTGVVTVVDHGSNTLQALSANTFATLTLASNGSANGTWQLAYTPIGAITSLNYYSGYFSNSESWTYSTSSFSDGSNSGGNTLTKRQSSGLSVAAAASSLNGITFTPSTAAAVYLITASFSMSSPGVNDYSYAQLTDGTTVIATGGTSNDSGNLQAAFYPVTLSSIYVPGTSSAVTIKIQGAVTAGSTTIGTSSSNAASVEWSIIQIGPIITGAGGPLPCYSGYHLVTNDSWEVTSGNTTSFVDFSSGTSISLVQLTSNGITAVTNASSLPGIDCTLPSTGYYLVTAIVPWSDDGLDTPGFKLTDGSGNAITSGTAVSEDSANYKQVMTLTGIYHATSTSATFKIQAISGGGGNVFIKNSLANFSGTTAGSIQWSIVGLGGSSGSGSSPTNNYFNGYMPAGSSWAASGNTSYIDPVNSGGNTLTTVYSSGLTVTAGASNVAGITFTPPSTSSTYDITAYFTLGMGSNAGASVRLYDGTTAFAWNGSNAGASGGYGITLRGIYTPGTTSPITVKIQVTGTTSNIEAGTSAYFGSPPSITWNVIQIK